MKKFKVISTIIFLILSLSFVACFCAGCDFIQYVEKSDNSQIISDEVKLLQENYVDKLYAVTSEIKYRENEQKIFDYALQDAVNELYECRSETQLKQVYEKHLTAIGKIKTDDEYSAEEEANAISAYRVAVLGNAEKSYDKQKYSQEQITYFDTVFSTFSGELFETNDREEMNELLQKFYFDVHKEDEILSLINYADISVYEESQKKLLTDKLNKCKVDIRSCIDEECIDGIKDVYKFEVYKRDTVKKLNEYVDLALYRDGQAAQIKLILKEQLNLAEEAETKVEEDNIFREYQIVVYNIPTDEMLYTEELEELKDELNASLGNTYKLSFYREDEGLTVQAELESFQELLETIKKKEDVLSQYLLVKSRLDSVKTAKELDEEDRVNLIEELYVQIQGEIDKNISDADRDTYLAKSELVYSAMYDRVSLDGVRQEYQLFVKEISGATIGYLRNELIEFNSTIFYRENEQNQVEALKEEYLAKFADDIEIDDAKALLQEAKDAIGVIKTNDDLWNDSVEEFRADLKSLYGDAILEEPRSLTEANDYSELAKIIDYYAFYQLSGTEFVCDTFRVKLNFAHNDAWTELFNVYWYCELIRTAAGMETVFECGDYFVVKLIPYNFASVSNIKSSVKRFESAVEFDSDKSKLTARSADFDDFAYYKYSRTINVWNSQQLWYALEHEYVPICKPDSSAEQVMNRAKEILREIIKEGMSDEEKIFQIYTWFGKTGQYDWKYQQNGQDEELSCQLRSYHIEGALFDSFSVCYGFAKTFLLLSRLEGLDVYYVFGPNSRGIDYNVSVHGHNYIKLNGNWYVCDPVRSFLVSPNFSMPTYEFFMLPAIKYRVNFFETTIYVHKDIDELIKSEAYLDWSKCQSLKIKNISAYINDLNDIKDKAEIIMDGTNLRLSIFCKADIVDDVIDYLIAFNNENQYNYDISKLKWADAAVSEIFIMKD